MQTPSKKKKRLSPLESRRTHLPKLEGATGMPPTPPPVLLSSLSFFITFPKKTMSPLSHSPALSLSHPMPKSVWREKKERKKKKTFLVLDTQHTRRFVLVMMQSFPLNILYYTGTWRLALDSHASHAYCRLSLCAAQHSTPRGQAEAEKAFIDSHQHSTALHPTSDSRCG